MTKQDIYDDKIRPLMSQILEICVENKIAMIADFRIPHGDDQARNCTSANLSSDCNPRPEQLYALKLLFPDFVDHIKTTTA